MEDPEPAHGEVVVEVRAARINPGEATIRSGALEARFPPEKGVILPEW